MADSPPLDVFSQPQVPVLAQEDNPLLDELTKLAEESRKPLPDMYLGAKYVVLQVGNPERFAHAGNSLRELIEAVLELKAGLGKREPLTNKCFTLKALWTESRIKKVLSDKLPSLSIEGGARNFLEGARDFFELMDNETPKRKELATRAVQGIDPAPAPKTPHETTTQLVDKLFSLRKYFEGATHHSHAAEDEFFKRMNETRIALHALLAPPTIAISEIDQLLSKESKT